MLDKNEYAPFYAKYIAKVEMKNLMEALIESMGEALTLFARIKSEKANFAYAKGKWNVKQVLQHAIDCERIFVYRALCISRGEKGNLPGFDENEYASMASVDHRNLNELIDEFANQRMSTIDFFNSLKPENLEARGNANGHSISVRAIGFIIAGHALHHLDVLEERYLPEMEDYNSSATTSRTSTI